MAGRVGGVRKLLAAGLAGALGLGLAGCGSDDARVERTVLMTADDRYEPRDLVVDPGDTVVWVNTDTELHTVTSDETNTVPAGPKSSVVYPNGMGQNDRYVFAVPTNSISGARWFYHCEFHGDAGDGTQVGAGMAGSLTVR